MSDFTKEEMETKFLHVLPKANQEFISQSELKPQNTSCTTTVFSTDFSCLPWLHWAPLHTEAEISLESLGLLGFKPLKSPEMATAFVVSLLSPAMLLNLSFVFFRKPFHSRKMHAGFS